MALTLFFCNKGSNYKAMPYSTALTTILDNHKPINKFMTKHFCTILALCMAAHAIASDFMVDGLNYTILSYNEVEVNGFSSESTGSPLYSAEQLDIPAAVEYNGTSYSVVAIGQNAFSIYNNIYRGNFTKVTLPPTIRDIKDQAFWFGSITSIELNEGLATIGNLAFGFTELTHIDFPNSLKSIGNEAFNGSKLTNVATRNVEEIGQWAFQHTPIETLTIGDGLRSIGQYAFFHCQHLTEILIPCNVVSVGEFAFGECIKVKQLTIEDGDQPLAIHNSSFQLLENILSIGDTSLENSGIGYEDDSALETLYIGRQYEAATQFETPQFFSSYSQLTSLTFGGGLKEILPYSFCTLPRLKSITIPRQLSKISADCTFYGCPELSDLIIEADDNSIMFSGTSLWRLKTATIGRQVEGEGYFFSASTKNVIEKVVFNGGFKEINNVTAFHSCTNLKEVVFDCQLSSICERAFSDCQSLTSVTIPNTVTSIGALAFKGCQSLLSVVNSDNVTVIPEQAFMNCSQLTSVHVGEKVSTVETQAFAGCASLPEVEFPDALKTIKNFAFYNCSALSAVTLGNNAEAINGFQGCTGLHEFRVPTIESWLNIKEPNQNPQPYSLIVGGEEFENLDVPDNITEIFPYAFRGCTTLKNVKLNNTQTLGNYAFHDCTNLRSFDTGNNITSFFSPTGCCSLKSLTLGENINGLSVLSDCDLDEVTCHSTFPPTAENATFSNATYSNAVLTVPNGTKDRYSAARGWERFKNIQEEPAPEIPVENISLNTLNLRLATGSQYQLEATVTPADATDGEVVWQTSNPLVANVSDKGLVIALSEGSCEISVASQNNPSVMAICQVEVYRETILVEEITLSPASIEGEQGNTFEINAVVLPADATDKSIEWTSNNPAIATVNEHGYVELHSIGHTTIVATALDGSMTTAECRVTVTEESGLDNIMAEEGKHVRIYTLTGVLIYEGEYSKFNHSSGIYIMTTDNGTPKRLVL